MLSSIKATELRNADDEKPTDAPAEPDGRCPEFWIYKPGTITSMQPLDSTQIDDGS